jgi:hypothetical protein
MGKELNAKDIKTPKIQKIIILLIRSKCMPPDIKNKTSTYNITKNNVK